MSLADHAPPATSVSLGVLVPGLVAVLLASAGAMCAAAALDSRVLSLAAAALLAVVIALAALGTNVPLWRDVALLGSEPRLQAEAMRRNARLAALVYAWGAAAMFAVYLLSGLVWRHGWQYGSGMALIAGAFLAYVHAMGQRSTLREARALRQAAMFTVVHGVAALSALGFLVTSGKLATAKGDWAANHVFLAGGAAIVMLCALTLVTHLRLAARAQSAPPG